MNWKHLLIIPIASVQLFAQYSLTLIPNGIKQYPTRVTNAAAPWPSKYGTFDIWGYVAADGSEYALVTTLDYISVVRIPEMVEVGKVTVPRGGNDFYPYQKLVRTYKKYMYSNCDGLGTNQGLTITDISGLDGPTKSIRFVKAYAPAQKIRSHTFDVDTVQGYAYIMTEAADGFRVVDIRNPESPVDVTVVDTDSMHDCMIDNGKNVLYVANGNSGYSIYDMSNKSNPVRKASWSKAGIGYSHNIWPTEDGLYAATTDETNGSPVLIWDLDKANGYKTPKVLGQWLGKNRLAHNAMIIGNLCFVPHYSYGVSVLDITNKAAPVEVAHYDAYPANDNPGYWGVFGVWVSPKGYVVTSNMDTGDLHVLKLQVPSFVRASDAARRRLMVGSALTRERAAAYSGTLSIVDGIGRSIRFQAGPSASRISEGAYFALPSLDLAASHPAGTAAK